MNLYQTVQELQSRMQNLQDFERSVKELDSQLDLIEEREGATKLTKQNVREAREIVATLERRIEIRKYWLARTLNYLSSVGQGTYILPCMFVFASL